MSAPPTALRPPALAFGVLGDPVTHSRSPAMHDAAFAALRLPHRYFAFKVAPERLGDALVGARALGLGGLNITVPHKRAVLSHLDWVSSEAARIGAVNTVCIRGEELQGHNTDGQGFLGALAELRGFKPHRAVVLGSGGAARAVVDALLHRRSPCPVDWVSRHPTRIPAWEGAHAHGYEALPQLMAGADLLVNATTVGMAGGPKSFPSPVAVEALAGRAAVIDIVYPRPPGGLLEAAQRVGARVQDGLPMLLWQGVRALEAWLGGPVSKPAIEAMRRALDESLLK